MPGCAATPAAAQVARAWASDEGRFGLRVGLRRCRCPRGVRPPWLVHDRCEWLWLYAAVEPATGQSFFLLLPRGTKERFQQFLEAFGRETAGERVGLALDGAGSHRADIPWPGDLAPLPLPRCSPELDPAEQPFRALRAELANRIFATLAELEAAIIEQLQPHWERPALVQRLSHMLRERVSVVSGRFSERRKGHGTTVPLPLPSPTIRGSVGISRAFRPGTDDRRPTIDHSSARAPS